MVTLQTGFRFDSSLLANASSEISKDSKTPNTCNPKSDEIMAFEITSSR